MNSRKSIVTQTVFRVSYVFIVVLVLFILAFTWFTGTYMKNHILENQREQIEIVADSLETRLNGLKEMAVSLANYQPTIALLAGYYESYTASWMENIRNLDSYLQNVNLFTGYIEDVNLVTSDSETLYSLRDVLRSDYPYTEQEWFEQALEREGVVKYAPPPARSQVRDKNIRISREIRFLRFRIAAGYPFCRLRFSFFQIFFWYFSILQVCFFVRSS